MTRLRDTPWFRSTFVDKLGSGRPSGPPSRPHEQVLAEYRTACVKASNAWPDEWPPTQEHIAEAWPKSIRNARKDIRKFGLPSPPPDEWRPHRGQSRPVGTG